MKTKLDIQHVILMGIVCGLLVFSAMFAGCTSTPSPAPATPVVTTSIPIPVATTAQPAAATTSPVAVTTTSVPTPVYTESSGNLVVYTAASLSGATKTIGPSFTAAYPGHKVVFNLAGTQTLKTQIEAGAYSDVFISASNSYTNTLKSEGYFVDGTVHPLTLNYVIVILPASNPGNIKSLADLAKPGMKIAIAAKEVPVGAATAGAIGNLANSTYGQDWKDALYSNVVTYETSEPAVATKVSLGEVDAGFVYESTYTAAQKGTIIGITIPKSDNYLQIYSIAILKESKNQAVAADFEQFMLSSAGQKILNDYGFRSVS
ncbi:MAG: molybdate ABC transporter substrate-binding protein [Methanoregula sp.]